MERQSVGFGHFWVFHLTAKRLYTLISIRKMQQNVISYGKSIFEKFLIQRDVVWLYQKYSFLQKNGFKKMIYKNENVH